MGCHITSILTDSDDFQNALRGAGAVSVVITEPGQLQVRLTQVALQCLRLVTVQENLPRVAFIRVPDNTVLLSFVVGGRTAPVWGGIRTKPDELVTVCGGVSLHARIDAPCHWCAIWFPTAEFVRYRAALTSDELPLTDAVCVWQPSNPAKSQLADLHVAANRAAHARWTALTMDDAAHGLEQQLIHASMNCLMEAPVRAETPAIRRHRLLAGRLEELLQRRQEGELVLPELSAALGVSDRSLRRACESQLGMSPMSYLRLLRMQLVHRALRHVASDTLRISKLAERYGFHNPGRFASAYRQLFGELPSSTLRRGAQGKWPLGGAGKQ